MKLNGNLYTILSQNVSANKAAFRVALHKENVIYQAHFPNNPITPGVCLIQIVVELFAVLHGADVSIKTLKKTKFTAPVSPLSFPEIDVELNFAENETRWQIKAVLKENDTVFAKISMDLI